MAITVANIQTAGDYFRRASETNDLTAAKALEAAALAIEDVHSHALFRFTQRRQAFDYLDTETDYSLLDSLRISDLRMIRSIRKVDDHNDDFDMVDPEQFDVLAGSASTNKVWALEYRDGRPILRLNQASLGSSTTVHSAVDHDANGTWTADTSTSDATNVSTDDDIYRVGGGSVRFDVDVSQSGNNRATISISDMTSVDLSDYQDQGVIRLRLYVPDVADDTSIYISSVEFRWGSDSSNYWSRTVTRPVDSALFTDRWNTLEFKWNDATQTGTVDETAIDYLLVTVNYGASQPDDEGFRINDIKIYNPKEMEMVYFSNSTVKVTSTGIWKARATAPSDELLCPDNYKMVYVSAYNWYVAQLLYPNDSTKITAYERAYRGQYNPRARKWIGGELERMVIEQGERAKIKQTKLTPQISFS